MLSNFLLLAITALSTLSAAQLPAGQNYSTPGQGNLTIDLTQIPIANRTTWCASQRAQCPLICGGHAFPNTCDASNVLGYQCVCSDGSTPNISDYTNTIPTFICETWLANCLISNDMDADAQSQCQTVVCGKKDGRENDPDSNSTSTSASATTSPTGSPSSTTPSSSGSAPATTTSGAANALLVGQSYGTSILATGFLGLFAFML